MANRTLGSLAAPQERLSSSAQETLLGILGLAMAARPLISASVGTCTCRLTLDLGISAARTPPDQIHSLEEGGSDAYDWD